MMPDIPFSIDTHFPPGSLRAVADDPDQMRRAVRWLVEQADSADDPRERARLLSLAGSCAGILGEVESARSMSMQAITIADQHDEPRPPVVFRIRLADVLAASGDPASAVNLLQEQLERCRQDERLESLRDFVHQHLGKALLETGDVTGGIEHLQQARHLREQKGDPDLLASTDQALSVARGLR